MNNECAVPATLATVIICVPTVGSVADDMRHPTVVPLVHGDVAQLTEATAEVGVRSVEAKARPLIVAVRPPEEGALRTPTLAQLRLGAARKRRLWK